MLSTADRWTHEVGWRYVPADTGAARKYDGVQINFLLPDFIAMGESGEGFLFVDWISKFCNTTGASATITNKSFPTEYREELYRDLNSGDYFYNVYNFFGSWLPSLVKDDHLLQLTDWVKNSPDIVWSDILPAVRRGVAEFQNKIYMLPADGDVIVMIYRKDLLDRAGLAKPDTWEDWLAVSKYFRENAQPGQEGRYGACMMTTLHDWAYANLFAYLSTILQAHGPSQGIFFDPVTMMPLLNSSVARDALKFYKDMVLNSNHVERREQNLPGAGLFTMIDDFSDGKCVMGITYMGPVKAMAGGSFNVANDTIALSQVPGSTWVKKFESNDKVMCNDKESNCPFYTLEPNKTNGFPNPGNERIRVNRATYYSGGGQSWAISSHIHNLTKQEAIWELLKSFIIQENAVLSTTAADYFLDPFRESTLEGLQVHGALPTELFMDSGWKWEQLGTMKETLNTDFFDENSVLDLKIIEGDMYIEGTDEPMLRYFNNEIEVDQAIDEITILWNSLTAHHTIEEQRSIYRSVLGLRDYEEATSCPPGQQVIAGVCQECEAGWSKAGNGYGPCVRCGIGWYQNETGQDHCEACEESLPGSTTELMGMKMVDGCVCPPEFFWYKDTSGGAWCKACPVGLECRGGRIGENQHHSAPVQAAGFASNAAELGAEPTVLVRCADLVRCPAGLALGTCPDHAEGRACDVCEAGYFMVDGECAECIQSQEYAIVAAIALCCIFLLVVLFLYSTRYMVAVERHATVLVVLSSGITIAALQALSALAALDVQWGQPLVSVQKVLLLFRLQFSVLRFDCMTGSKSALTAYAKSLAVYPGFAILVFLMFGVARLVGRNVKPTQVFNAQGIVIMAAYLSLSLVTTLPWQCRHNPDDSYSVFAFPRVRCWDTADHQWMLLLSTVACLIFTVGFLTLVTWVTIQYPSRVTKDGGVGFLTAFKFLFARFKPDRYYYALIYAVRNLVIALTPVLCVNQVTIQVMVLVFLITTTGMLQCRLMPWRIDSANVLDIVFSIGLSLVLLGGAMLLNLSGDSSSNALQGFLIVVLTTAFGIALAIVAVYSMRICCPRRDYGIFLSHHKAGAAVLARWFKMAISDLSSTRVFLDSDDVDLLDKIIDTCAFGSENVVVLLTRQTLERIWCAGEIASAVRNDTNIVLVACDDFPGITETFMDNLPSLWGHTERSALSRVGIDLHDIQAAYIELRNKEMISLARGSCTHSHERVVRAVLANCTGIGLMHSYRDTHDIGHVPSAPAPLPSDDSVLRMRVSNSNASSRIHILGNFRDAEAVCICRVLQRYLQPLLIEPINVLEPPPPGPVEVPSGMRYLLVVLTRGVLQVPAFAATLTACMEDDSVEMIPIHADQSFVYPGDSFWAECEKGTLIHWEELWSMALRIDRIELAYKALFNILALKFSAHGSEMIQTTEVQVLAIRLQRAPSADPASYANQNAEESMVYL